MHVEELLNFLRLLKNCGCLDQYWKDKIDDVIHQITTPIQFVQPPM